MAAGGDAYAARYRRCLDSQRAFCAAHAVPYYFSDDLSALIAEYGQRPYPWYKLLLLKQALQQHECAIWLDCDVLSATPQQNHFSALLLGLAQTEKQVLCAVDDAGNINTGVLLFRGGDGALDMLDAIWAQTQYTHHPWWENQAFIHLFNADKAFRARCNLVPTENCHILQGYPGYAGERRGAVVLHFAGQLKPLIESYVPAHVNFSAVMQGIQDYFSRDERP